MKNKISILLIILSCGISMPVHAEEKPGAFIYDDKNNRDPFWPLISDSGMLQNYEKEYLISDLELEGIIASPDGKSIAILNGKVVRINDPVGEYMVKDIQANKVILLKGEQTFELILKKGE